MKKIILLLLFVPLIGFSQEFGNYKIEKALLYNNNTVFVSNQWYKDEEGKFCIKKYNKTPIGIKNAMSDVKTILYSNKVDFNSPFIDDTYLSSIVKNIEDYEILNIEIKSENSEVNKQWRISDYNYLVLRLKKEGYEINLFRL